MHVAVCTYVTNLIYNVLSSREFGTEVLLFNLQVVVIEQGEVVEQGTHDQLIAQGGVYKQLVLRQLIAGQESI